MAKGKKKEEAKPKEGRPSLYRELYNEQAYKLCLLGATDAELGDFFEVCEKTINNWKIEFPEFLQSIKKGKQLADVTIAESLFERAKGCTVITQKAFKIKIGKDEEKIEVVEVAESFPPDTTAAIFWLKNRKPKEWRDKHEIDHSTGGKSFFDLLAESSHDGGTGTKS